MIVRDSSRTLKACLQSIAPWVDEMVVVDTGSRDDTPEDSSSARQASVFHFPWCDSFATARNESLRHARGEWIVWIDSDDAIDPINGRKLRQITASQIDPNVLGVVMQVQCPGPGANGDENVTVVDQVKLFRNHRGLRFDRRIHEQVLGSIRRAGGTVIWSDIFVVHAGHDYSTEGQARKRARDLRLLQMEFEDNPGDPFTLFNFGMTYTDMDRHAEGADYLLKCIKFSHPEDSHLRKAYALLVYDYRMLGQLGDAWRFCQEGLALFPEDCELLFRSGILLHEMGQSSQAVEAYRRAIACRGPLQFGSYDVGIRGFKARHNLAITLTEMGNLAAAEVEWREIVRERPLYRAGWRGLGESLTKQKCHATALTLADQLIIRPLKD